MEHNKGSPYTTMDIYSFRRHCGTLLYVCSYVCVYELIARAFSDSKCDGRERVRRYRVLYYQILLYTSCHPYYVYVYLYLPNLYAYSHVLHRYNIIIKYTYVTCHDPSVFRLFYRYTVVKKNK